MEWLAGCTRELKGLRIDGSVTAEEFLDTYDMLSSIPGVEIAGMILDHDLGPESAGTGRQVVLGLIERKDTIKPGLRVLVWSNNTVAARGMADDLTKYTQALTLCIGFGIDNLRAEMIKAWIYDTARTHLA